MKKLLLSLAACCGLASAYAQLPNSVLLYTDLGFSSYKDSAKNNERDWNADIGIGYQFNDHMTVGLNLGFTQETYKFHNDPDREADNTYRLGAFLRHSCYIAHSKTFFAYGQLNVGYHGGYITEGDKPTFGKHSGFYVNVMPALGVNFGNAWCLNFSVGGLGYETDKYKDVDEGTHLLSFTLGQAVQIGVSKNFGGHHMGHHEPMDDTRNMDSGDDDEGGSKKKKAHHDDDE